MLENYGRIESAGKDRPTTETSTTVHEKFVFGDSVEYLTGSKENPFPPNVKKFVKIAAFQGELLALTGALIPLIRNAIGGYCEPVFLGFTGMQHNQF